MPTRPNPVCLHGRGVRAGIALLGMLILCGIVSATVGWADDWPQWRGPERDGVWRESGIVDRLPAGALPHVWAVPVGPGYSGPTVADGRVYLTDRGTEGEQAEQERVLCFDARDGRVLWSHSYAARYTISYRAGPRAAVTVADGRAYAVGAMGHFHCFDAATGRVLWKRDLQKDYAIDMPGWGIAAAPLVYDDLVIQQVGGSEGACMVAFSAADGTERWRALGDRAGYSSPIVIQQAGRDVLVCWTADTVSGLSPDDGTVAWSVPFPPVNMPIGIATPVTDGERLFVSSFYDGSLMLRLNPTALAVDKLWQAAGPNEQQTESLHVMIGTPILKDGHVYGVDSYGQLRCLNADTGQRIWEDTTAVPPARWATIHMVQHDQQVWMFNDQGELIIARLSPQGFEELSRAKLIDRTTVQLARRGGVTWSHPAFANRHVFARNDQELVCASLAAAENGER